MARSRMTDLRLDHGGMRSVLRSSEVQREITGLADDVAADVIAVLPPDAGETVVDSGYQSDRASASVTIKDPRARGWQARDGVLTRAAAGHGLEIGSRATALTYTTRAGVTRTATAAQIANWTRGR